MSFLKRLFLGRKMAAALLEAAEQGNVDTAKALIKAGVDVNARDHNGITALMWAAYRGHADCVKALIAGRAQMEVKASIGGDTSLIYAAGGGHADCVKALVAAGANVNARTDGGMTALQAAVLNSHADCAAILQAAEKTVAVFPSGSSVNEDLKASLNAKDMNGRRCL